MDVLSLDEVVHVARHEALARVGAGSACAARLEADAVDVAEKVAPRGEVAEHVGLGVLVGHRLGGIARHAPEIGRAHV